MSARTQDAVVSSSISSAADRKRLAPELHSQPSAKRRPSSAASDDRFSSDSDVEITSETILYPPSTNTKKNTKWAMSNFSEWQKKRNARFPGEKEQQVPADLLKSSDPELLNKWIALYAAETQKQGGGAFPPKTIYYLLAGVLRHMRSLNPACPNFLHTANSLFKPLHDSLHNTFREFEENNTVPEPKSAKSFSGEEENRLWTSGALSTDTPMGLLRAVFFLNGKNFGVVGMEKQRHMKISQLLRILNPPRYMYTEAATDSETGLICHKKSKKSQVYFVDASVEKGNRCHVHVLDLYLQRLPAEAFQKDAFYLQPIKQFRPMPPSSFPIQWFNAQPVGKNCLSRMVRDICADAGIDGLRTLKHMHRDQNPPSQQLPFPPTQQRSNTGSQGNTDQQLPFTQLPQTQQSSTAGSTEQHTVTTGSTDHQTAIAGSTNQQSTKAVSTDWHSATAGSAGHQSATTDLATVGSNDQQLATVAATANQQSSAAGAINQQSATAGPSDQILANSGNAGSTYQREANAGPSDQISANVESLYQRAANAGFTNQQSTNTNQQSTALPSPTVQGYNVLRAIPQQLSFTNCQVTIYVTPPQRPPNT